VEDGSNYFFIAGILAASFLVRRYQIRFQGMAKHWRRPAIVLVSALAFLNFSWYVLPLVTVENVMSGNLQPPDPAKSTGVRARFASRDAWFATVCPHLPAAPANAYSTTVTGCQQSLGGQPGSFQNGYAEQLDWQLIQNALNVAWLTVFAALVCAAAGYYAVQWMDWDTMLMAALLTINLLGLPFQYGKTARLHEVPYAALYLAPDLSKIGFYKYGLILYDADSGYTFIESQTRKIWFLPRANVAAVQIYEDTDVLGFYATGNAED
jgi:hypothetical protein